jgi:hypothetical protein
MHDQSAADGAQVIIGDGTKSPQLLSDPSNGAGAPPEFEIRLDGAATNDGRKALRSRSSATKKKVAAHLAGASSQAALDALRPHCLDEGGKCAPRVLFSRPPLDAEARGWKIQPGGFVPGNGGSDLVASCPGLEDPTWWLSARDPPLELKLGAGGSSLVASCPGLEEPTLEAEARGWRIRTWWFRTRGWRSPFWWFSIRS